ncbi:histidine kinase [Longimicrobium sp.]|uniref:histidine kinase n=1 Tax=Longimicrobium sp. TaxID=2029185 RepID=UPI002E2FFE48|nr:histidine kinase [Longimicrobium sp.]HEX6038003.1 histidine kinase [Longimicrobium sp.]
MPPIPAPSSTSAAPGLLPPGALSARETGLATAGALVCMACVWSISYQLPAYGDYPPSTAVALGIMTTVRWALLGTAATLVGRGVAFRRAPTRARAVGTAVALAALVCGVVIVERPLWVRAGAQVFPLDQALARDLPGLLVMSVTFVGLGAGLRRLRRRREQQVELSRMEAELAGARLRAAQQAVRPELLLESLDRVGREMREDPHRADESLVRVAEFLRLALRGTRAGRVPLAREVEFVHASLRMAPAENAPVLRVVMEPAAESVPVPHAGVLALVEVLVPARACGAPLSLHASVTPAGRLALRLGGMADPARAAAELRGVVNARGESWQVLPAPGGAVVVELPAREDA